MGNSDLSADLTLGILTPASSVRPVEGHSPHPDAEGKARRRSRPKRKTNRLKMHRRTTVTLLRTSSTIWPESMTPQFPDNVAAAPDGRLGREESVELACAQLALLEQLEISLQITQKALLTRDLSALEQGTCEQTRLCRALQILAKRTAAPARNGEPPGTSEPIYEAELRASLQAAQARVLHLGRVQAALLVRAQRSLTMIANLLAGPQASYTPPPATAQPRPWKGDHEREEHECRV